jgi:UDP-N-acetylmuramoylalanine--D-glutamate ligase
VEKPGDFVVLELSSFQLEDLDQSPHIAVITNLFQEHLAPADPNNPNYHRSMKDYWAAKANIFAHQKKNDYLIINEKLKEKTLLNPLYKEGWLGTPRRGVSRLDYRRSLSRATTRDGNDGNGKIIFYDKSELKSNLIGEHNKENVAAAAAVAKILKIKDEVVKKAVRNFKGLPHRLELVAEKKGVKYFDDSFATVPDVSVIALKAIVNNHPQPHPSGILGTSLEKEGGRNVVLLAGGADKGSDFKNFAKEIKKHVKFLILFKGKGSERLKKSLRVMRCALWAEVYKMKDAINIAKKQAKPGDIVLLSTGCASFGCFKNYKDRGNQFKAEVKKQK